MSIENPEEQRKFFLEQLCDALPTEKTLNEDLHYFIDQKIFENAPYNWEDNISISANRLFDAFAIIDNPRIISPNHLNSYYVNGSSFSNPDGKNLNNPKYEIITHDCYLEHGRNAYVKNDLFYIQTMRQSHEKKTMCVIPNPPDSEYIVTLKDIKIPH